MLPPVGAFSAAAWEPRLSVLPKGLNESETMKFTRNLACGLAVATLAWSGASVQGQPSGVLPAQLTPAQQRMMLSVSARHQLMSFSRVHALRARLILPKDAPIWELWVNDWTHGRRIPTSNAPALARAVCCDQRASDSWKYVFTFNGVVAADYAPGTHAVDAKGTPCALSTDPHPCVRLAARPVTSPANVVESCLASVPALATQFSAAYAAAHQWSPEASRSEVLIAMSPDVAAMLPKTASSTPPVAAGPKK